MNIEKITDNILYAGVNDRTTARFEAMWPLPYGVSYNSYIVKGKSKCALIDTVDIKECRSLVEHVSEAVPGGCLNFLVVNHTEPDHSGSIPVLAEIYPQMQIVCNKISAEQIKGFYHIDESRLLVIKDGDAIDLGGLTLRFVTVPMVHWPETMVTYCEEEQVLFSGDAFGCYGALNGSIIDDNIDAADMAAYFSEMRRYYACIVGKYGGPVQKALAKVRGLNPTTICSTHGPVWQRQIPQVMDIYDRLSRYEGEPGVVLAYGSMYGNTEQMAERIARELASRGVGPIVMYNLSFADESVVLRDVFRYDTLIVGAPTYNGGIYPPAARLLDLIAARCVPQRNFGWFGSFCWAGAAVRGMGEFAQRMKWEPICDPVEMKQGFSSGCHDFCSRFADGVAERFRR